MRRWMAATAMVAATASPAPAQVAATPPCAADWLVARLPSSIGDPAMAPAMDVLQAGYRAAHPADAPPLAWDHRSDARAIGALMFATADLAPISRPFTAAELAPYDHQYRGDMMKAPLAVRIGSVAGRPATIAVNRRPDSPLPPRVRAFLDYALSAAGRRVLARVAGFAPLTAAEEAAERARYNAFVAPLDPALGRFALAGVPAGAIRSVGSDGMKDLLDGWSCRFATLAPGVVRGARWEHVGTLNGFHALLSGQADIAPMGRELWPQERAAWQKVHGTPAPVEIRVARGGFDTPQRTTAQAIFVHPDNPVARLSVAQLADIFGANPTLVRWGQLGLTGAWADRPIRVLMPPRIAPNAMSMQLMLLDGGAWNPAAVEAPYAATAQALLADPGAIGFGGLEEGAPGLRAVPVVPRGARDAVAMTAADVAAGRYPFTRYMYVRLAAGPPPPHVRAFLRYILSREGQERVRYSGYLPLAAAESRAELVKLAALAP